MNQIWCGFMPKMGENDLLITPPPIQYTYSSKLYAIHISQYVSENNEIKCTNPI